MNYFCRRSDCTLLITSVVISALAAISLLDQQAASAVTIDMANVGNPGNAPDTRYNGRSFGSVSYAYQIGKYEVTAGQYTEFLNAVAKADPNGLYNPMMSDPIVFYGANIQRIGTSPDFSYTVASDWTNRPVNYVSLWDVARFANWLHNGQPPGAQGPGTTESGAYLNIGSQTTFARQPGARYFIPTENEWYKAAYHDKNAGLAAAYFDYATKSNSPPGNDLTELTNPGNNANYYINKYLLGSPIYRTEVGEFELSVSPYGTFDQSGNVYEWNETTITDSTRGLRGGSFGYPNGLSASDRSFFLPSYEGMNVAAFGGFRVAGIAAIPEPTSLILVAMVSVSYLRRWVAVLH